jgi:hypothetical protein
LGKGGGTCTSEGSPNCLVLLQRLPRVDGQPYTRAHHACHSRLSETSAKNTPLLLQQLSCLAVGMKFQEKYGWFAIEKLSTNTLMDHALLAASGSTSGLQDSPCTVLGATVLLVDCVANIKHIKMLLNVMKVPSGLVCLFLTQCTADKWSINRVGGWLQVNFMPILNM